MNAFQLIFNLDQTLYDAFKSEDGSRSNEHRQGDMVFHLWEFQSCNVWKRLWPVTVHPALPFPVDTHSKIRDYSACKCGPGTVHLGSIGTLKCYAGSNANRVCAAQGLQQPLLHGLSFSNDHLHGSVLTNLRFFSPADIRGIGSFQDRELQNNLAADIAQRVPRQIWPSRKNPARLLSMETGVTPRTCD